MQVSINQKLTLKELQKITFLCSIIEGTDLKGLEFRISSTNNLFAEFGNYEIEVNSSEITIDYIDNEGKVMSIWKSFTHNQCNEAWYYLIEL